MAQHATESHDGADLETEAREATVALQEAAAQVGDLIGVLSSAASNCRDEVDDAFDRLLDTAAELRRRESMIAALGEEAMVARHEAIRRERAAAELSDEALQVAIELRSQAEAAQRREAEVITELQERLAATDGAEDREELVHELELVRSNLAAISAELDEERRRFSQQSQTWEQQSHELEQRCATAEEQLAAVQAAPPPAVAPAPVAAAPQPAPVAAPAVVRNDADPVLGPLMQQFELLQRTRRRGELAGAP